MKDKINGYNLSRAWFDFAFNNRDIVDCKHTAMYFYCIDLCNRLGWVEKFGLPTDQTMNALSIKNYRTYIKVFEDLVEWKFLIVHKLSKNQHTSTVIALVKNTKTDTNAHTKAIQNQSQKQSIDTATINKPINNKTLKPQTDIINNISVELRSTYDNLPKTKESIFEFIKNNKPLFIEPYIEYWNIFADAYSMAKVKTLTEKRKKKLLVRLKEESFSFTKILIKLSVASDFVLTKKWLTFDWIIESQANYVKILEGNYDKVKSDTENDKTVSSNSPQYKSFDERS